VVETKDGRIVDEVLLMVMKAPRSYTREDVVEISAHGGRAALEMILRLILDSGARLAEPGEFTRRAFLNGRIDLTQAEAVIDLINARSRSARQIAANQVAGHLRTAIEDVREALLAVLAVVEAGIDFPEEMEAGVDEAGGLQEKLLKEVITPLERLSRNHADARLLREGVSALIVGRPNVGKSSLLNRIVKKDRAIVTDTPGTTRDFIEESFQFKGTAVTVIDTAGIQDTPDPIERRGIEKTKELIRQADVVLLVLAAGDAIGDEDRRIFAMISKKNVIVVQNKADLLCGGHLDPLPGDWQGVARAVVSAKTGQGLDDLMAEIETLCLGGDKVCLEDQIVPNLRQAGLLAEASGLANQGAAVLEQGLPVELAAIDFKEALAALDQSLGIGAREDVLEEIFSRFCIGK
jgi:tRNA modification GTPase